MIDKSLVEEHLRPFITSDSRIEFRNSNEFANFDRIDIGIKLFFLKCYEDGNEHRFSTAKAMYLEHIRCFSFGKYFEYGDRSKVTEEDFLNNFVNLYHDMKLNGFNIDKSVVPVSKDQIPINGSHRIAIAILLGYKIPTVQLDLNGTIYGINYFRSRHLKDVVLSTALNNIITHNTALRVGILWPAGADKEHYIRTLINHSFESLEIDLDMNSILNLLTVVYKHEDWMRDSVEYSKTDIYNKCFGCLGDRKEGKAFIIFYSEFNQESTLEFKQEIREIVARGKSSIHMADNTDESIEICDLLIGEESRFWLKKVDFEAAKGLLIRENATLRKIQSKLGSSFLISGSSFVELLGGRKANDIDFVDLSNKRDSTCHSNEYRRFGMPVPDYKFGRGSIFSFYKYKFVDFSSIIALKENRSEPKDILDLEFLHNIRLDIRPRFHTKVMTVFRYYKVKSISKCKAVTLNTLTYLGLYKLVRRLYYFIK
tara:strand:+ start:2382 stop:3830 length:1449 start_codon:yes stop_codon:yes gene_type:complete